MSAWLQLINGKAFEPFKCQKEDISIEVIAHALSNICRFGGHTKRFYSVAEHSVHVASLLPSELKIYGLLHDAHEAYTGHGDVAGPMKPDYLKVLESSIDYTVAEHFKLNVDFFYSPEVKLADQCMLNTERLRILGPSEREWAIVLPMPADIPLENLKGNPEVSRQNFLDLFWQLTDF